jgi:hypothetical protein
MDTACDAQPSPAPLQAVPSLLVDGGRHTHPHAPITTNQQADLFKPNHYLSLLAFRDLTLKRLQAFVAGRFRDGSGGPARPFDVADYLAGAFIVV